MMQGGPPAAVHCIHRTGCLGRGMGRWSWSHPCLLSNFSRNCSSLGFAVFQAPWPFPPPTHPPALSPPRRPLQHPLCPTSNREVFSSACLGSSLLGLDEDQKQRPVLTEAWSCREGGSRLPNSFWTTKEVVTPEPRANGGGEANLHQDSGPGVMFLRVSLTVSARLGVGAAAYSPPVPPSAWNWSSLMNS